MSLEIEFDGGIRSAEWRVEVMWFKNWKWRRVIGAQGETAIRYRLIDGGERRNVGWCITDRSFCLTMPRGGV